MNIFPSTLEILLANYSLYAGKRADYSELEELDKLAGMIDDPVTSEFNSLSSFELISRSLTPTDAELYMTHLDSRVNEGAGIYWLEDGYYLISFLKKGEKSKVQVSLLSYYRAPIKIGFISGFSELFNREFQAVYATVFA